jgi:hypothetical protein
VPGVEVATGKKNGVRRMSIRRTDPAGLIILELASGPLAKAYGVNRRVISSRRLPVLVDEAAKASIRTIRFNWTGANGGSRSETGVSCLMP